MSKQAKQQKKIMVKRAVYEGLLERFDLKNVEVDGDGDYVVNIACSACREYYKHGCADCPFDVCATTGANEGCVQWLDAVAPNNTTALRFAGSPNSYWWSKADNRQARAAIRKIRKAIVEHVTYRGRK